MDEEEEKNIYERTLQVTMIITQFKEPIQYQFEQFKKRDEPFKLTVISPVQLFNLGDIVALTIAKVGKATIH